MPQCESCSEPLEMQSVVRGHNRTLRRIVRTLRQRIYNGKSYTDELFVQLCETKPDAELAIRRLWEEGGFQPPCGPEDYDFIVETSLRALKAYQEAASNGPAVSESAT